MISLITDHIKYRLLRVHREKLNVLIKLHGCVGCPESSLFAHMMSSGVSQPALYQEINHKNIKTAENTGCVCWISLSYIRKHTYSNI